MKILSFESGGTKLVASVFDQKANLLERNLTLRRSDQTAEETLQAFIRLGRELLGATRPLAVGFGFGGTVRRSDGHTLHCYHEDGWPDTNAKSLLEEVFEAPVFVENDCNLAALAEAWKGFSFTRTTCRKY